jgi:hypothetical protein
VYTTDKSGVEAAETVYALEPFRQIDPANVYDANDRKKAIKSPAAQAGLNFF